MASIQSISLAAIQGISDPNARQTLKAIADVLAVRNGDVGTGENAFLTVGDLTKAGVKATAVANALAKHLTSGPNPGAGMIALAEQLEQRILALPEWQALFARVNLLDAPDTSAGSVAYSLLQEAKQRAAAITNLHEVVQTASESLAHDIETVTAATGQNAAAIQTETKARTDAASAEAKRLDLILAATGSNIAGIQSDLTVKTNNDNALASAVNTLWAKVGDNSALVQTGAQIVVNNTGSALTKFDQLQAVTTDPVTGLVAKSTALRQEYNLTADVVAGMMGNWSVKLDLNGYIAGLSLNSSVDTAGRTRSNFLVLADVFAVGAPGRPDIVPFSIDAQTGLVGIRGDLVVRRSLTADSMAARTITANEIATGTITAESGVIADLAVNTLQIAGNAVTVPKVMAMTNNVFGSGNTFVNILSTSVTLYQPGTVLAIVTCSQGSRDGNHNWNMRLSINGVIVASAGGASPLDAVALSGALTVPAGTYTVSLSRQSEGDIWAHNRNLTIFGVMR